MNIFGMGMMELAVVLLVAFLVLGPGRSIELARRSGKALGDLRRSFSDVTDAISAEDQQRSRPPPTAPPGVPTRPDLPDDDPPDASGGPAASGDRGPDRA